MVKTKLNGLNFWYREDDRFIGQRIALEKYEEYETKLITGQVGRNDVVVDVGANIGYYTLLMAQRAKKVYAIEPEGVNFKILEKNVRENNFRNVVLVRAGASDGNETKYLIKDSENYGNHRLGDKVGITVNCLRLDDALVLEQKISLIKVDTQGWEPAVIKGAEKIIGRDFPTLFVEYNPGEGSDKMLTFLKKIYQRNMWQIDSWFYVSKSIGEEVVVDPKTGYADLWMKRKTNLADVWARYKDVRIKKLIKRVLGVQ